MTAARMEQAEELTMSTDEFLQAELELYRHSLLFVRSLALKAATDLRIPDAIHRRGGAATLPDLAAEAGIHQTMVPDLRRLMRVLTASGIFSVDAQGAGDAPPRYKLTPVSRLLVDRSPHNLSRMVDIHADPLLWNALLKIPQWLTHDHEPASPASPSPRPTPFDLAHGRGFWNDTVTDGGFFSSVMAADSRVVMPVLLKEHARVFQDVRTSLVDVGGSHGATAKAVAAAFPHLKCTVLDLPDVVAGAPAADDTSLTFVAGDMFKHIPPADAVLLKWILHDWKHEDCVKIMRRCKEAIPARDAGGKVIIIDMVIGYPAAQQDDSKEVQVLVDVCMMYMDGIEREEHEWSKMFTEAGFSDYKITPANGVRSIIEAYP